MTRRLLRDIRRSSEFDDIFNRLGSREYKWPGGQRPDGAPLFGTIRELMCFAAFLGFHCDRREKIEGPTLAVPEEVFAKNEDALESVRMIALAKWEDQEIFGEDKIDDMVTIFEEYAHGGMKIIQRFLVDLPTDVLGADAIIEGLRKENLLDRPGNGCGSPDLRGVRF